MCGLKVIVNTFHKRVLNLNTLRLFYFLKKEYNIVPYLIINKKVKYKLFNILKSPIQFKIARNQLSIVSYKAFIFLNFKFVRNKFPINKILLYRIIKFLKLKVITSNTSWLITKFFRV